MSFFIRFSIFIFYFILSLLIISCTSSSKLGSAFAGDDESEEYMDEDEEEAEYAMDDEEDFKTDERDEDSPAFVEKKSSDEDDFILEPVESDALNNESDYTDYVSAPSPQTKKSWVPLKKIPQTTWKHDGKWINAVYIARQGDQLSSITSLIYGSPDRQDELKSINPFLKRRSPKVGDKIYYNSPQRPKDRQKFLVYYEDIQQTPSTYDIPAGENIRKVSTQLLGHSDSWKEIWATNLQVESKGVLEQPVTIQYWSNNSEPPQEEIPPPMEDLPPEESLPAEPPLEDPLPAPSPEEPLEDVPFEEPELEEPVMDTPIAPMDNNIPELPVEGEGNDETQKFQLLNMGSWKVKGAIIGLILIIIGLWFAKLIRSRKGRSEFDFSQTNIDIDNIDE